VAAMVAVFLIVAAVPFARDFFALSFSNPADIAYAVLAAALAAGIMIGVDRWERRSGP